MVASLRRNVVTHEHEEKITLLHVYSTKGWARKNEEIK